MSSVKPIFLRTYGRKRRRLTAWFSPKKHKQAFDSSLSTHSDDSSFEPDKKHKIRAKNCSSKGKLARPTGRKAKENVSDEDVSGVPLLFCPRPAPRAKTTSRTKVTIRQKERQHPITRESDEDLSSSAKGRKKPLQINTASNLPHPSLGCNVTCRRRPVTTKLKVSKAKGDVINSFDDFISEEESQIWCPDRKKMVLLSMLDSSVENSTSNLDSSLGPPPKKPIFCSTPSACLSSKRPHIPPFPVSDRSPKPTSLSVIYIGASACPEDQDSLRQPCCAPPVVLHSDENQQSSVGEPTEKAHPPFHEGHSYDLYMHPRSMNETSRDCKVKNNNCASGSKHLLTAHRGSGSCFVSTVEDLLSLTEVLKEKCLTQRCTVQVKRLGSLTVSQLCTKTAYASRLADLSSARRRTTTEQSPIFIDILSAQQSNESNLATAEDEDGRRSSTNDEPDSQTSDIPIGLSLSAGIEFTEESTSAHTVESTRHSNSSFELFTCAQLTAGCPGEMATGEQAADDTFEGNKCKVLVEQLELEEIKRASSQRLSEGRSRYNVDTQSRAQSPSTALVQKCLTDKLAVQIQRLTSTQLKELQQKGKQCKSLTNVSDLSNEDLTRSKHQTETDSNHDKISCKGVEKGLADSDSLDKEANKKCSKVDQQAYGPVGKKKVKRVSLLPGQPATTRKACVSGLSVSRWKNDGRMRTPRTFKRKSARRAADCTVNHLIWAQPDQLQLSVTRRQPHRRAAQLQGHTMTLSTPERTSPLKLSSPLADFTPRTQHWNRLKAALSVHRKVLLTPQTSKKPKPTDINQLMYDADLSDAEKVYAECGQRGPLPWKECISPLQMKRCTKIGEGTFGEVFSTSNSSGETVALKVIPLEGNEKVNGEDQKTFGEILHEIIISKELSSLKEKHQNQTSSFIGLNDLHCVRGRYPPEFLKAWDAFDRKKGSENDRPDFFENDQLFIILEFEFGGVDLESSNRTLSSLVVAKSILHQVTAALAVAEQQLHFEHRDLHWGNVLVKTTKQKTGSFLLNGAAHSVEVKGVFVRIIDYSLSRLEIDGLTVSCDISNDEELFTGQGDYQFDIYRRMREENGNKWDSYHPHSNVLWLHYLCSKLLSMKFRRAASKDARKQLTCFRDNILRYASATEALRSCPVFQ
ncbi:uncharacterized protein haspin isoform X3 [Phyllopteryx taeniolatus]|uniref:uncharacterized protein haspin isoform X3 n=1 Tax=Phyllopteryx taeniolatus TaxID=161469 RepID=UPI002AD3BD41|nr:uncharacterized protein haspin isoform X3 [Phyllopteryx taeniolatus]